MLSGKLQDIQTYNRPSQSHHDLKVYQRSYEASLNIYEITSGFPEHERYGITSQIRRASSSICANIAEGYGRQMGSDADFKRFLVMAKGSCHEMGVWIDFCLDLGFIDKKQHQEWQEEYIEISKMLFSLIKKL